jgi:maltose O-acetyltransferase
MVLGMLLDVASRIKSRLDRVRLERRWARLRAMGMRIGNGTWLPASTWIDTSHCFLISIGSDCGFGEECLILAHDAQMDEFLDVARIGRVVIHDSCHIGARTVVLAGVEIGPRTVVTAGSVVMRSLPPNTVCAGNPARPIMSLDDYLEKHRKRVAELPNFPYQQYDVRVLTPERRAELVAAVASDDAYMTGGRSAELRGEGGTPRTAFAEPPSPRNPAPAA